MQVLSISGSHNGSPIGVIARHHDDAKLPERYLRKSKPKVARRSNRTDLTDDQVYGIRDYGDAGNSHCATARKFGVGVSTARKIIKRLAFTYLPEKQKHNDTCQHLFANRKVVAS